VNQILITFFFFSSSLASLNGLLSPSPYFYGLTNTTANVIFFVIGRLITSRQPNALDRSCTDHHGWAYHHQSCRCIDIGDLYDSELRET
jgi:hypothetical protein